MGSRKEKQGKRWEKVENWLGQTQIKIDDKGRMALPVSAAVVFTDEEIVLSVGVFDKKPYLELLTLDSWNQKLKTLSDLPEKHPKTKAYKRFLLSGSAKVSFDKQKRITLPVFQRDLIKLVKESVLVNMDGKYELWSEDHWSEVSHNYIQSFENLEDWAMGFDEDSNIEEEAAGELKSVA
jgi:MraZ protein